MKLFSYLFLFILFPLFINGQTKYELPNIEKIKSEVKKPSSKYYLPKLIDRYKNTDTSLGVDELKYLYYGYSSLNNYNPLPYSDKKKEVALLNKNKKNYESNIATCNKWLEKDLFDLDFFNIKSVCMYETSHNNTLSETHFNFYYNICKAIKSTGNGTSKESPIYIINLNHIDFLASLLGFSPTGVQTIDGPLVLVELKPNLFEKKYLYFDISQTKDFVPKETIKIASSETYIAPKVTDILSNKTSQELISSNNTQEQEIVVALENNTYAKLDKLSLKEQLMADRVKKFNDRKEEQKRIIEERAIAKQKLIEEHNQAREQLIEERRLIKEQFLKQRENFSKNKEN